MSRLQSWCRHRWVEWTRRPRLVSRSRMSRPALPELPRCLGRRRLLRFASLSQSRELIAGDRYVMLRFSVLDARSMTDCQDMHWHQVGGGPSCWVRGHLDVRVPTLEECARRTLTRQEQRVSSRVRWSACCALLRSRLWPHGPLATRTRALQDSGAILVLHNRSTNLDLHNRPGYLPQSLASELQTLVRLMGRCRCVSRRGVS